MDKAVGAVVGILGGFILLAIWSVVLAPNSQTAQVLTAGGNAVANIIKAAVSPTTGSNATVASAPGISGAGLAGTLSGLYNA